MAVPRTDYSLSQLEVLEAESSTSCVRWPPNSSGRLPLDMFRGNRTNFDEPSG